MITVNSTPLEWNEGMSVQDVLDAKGYTFNRIMIWLDGKPVADPDTYRTTLVPDNCMMQVIHIFAGG